jgi:hypothetical protein
MIPPAPMWQSWLRLALAVLLPVPLIAVGLRESVAQAQPPSDNPSTAVPEGIYLYGTSPRPNQMARDYVLFERDGDKVVGAFYVPQSEFTCFSGDIEGSQLDVEAVAYDASRTFDVQAQLDDLYELRTISANDQRILATCKEEAIVP